MPIFIIGTLRFGVATPAEVSVMAVAYALLIGIFFHRDVTPRLIRDARIDTARITGAVMLITMASGTIQWIPAARIATHLSEPWMVLIALNLVMLVMECSLTCWRRCFCLRR